MTGTSIRRPEARGLRQGPGDGSQVEEVGGEQYLHNTTRRITTPRDEEQRLQTVIGERVSRRASSLYMYIPNSPNKFKVRESVHNQT
jgi:hypothetical protein